MDRRLGVKNEDVVRLIYRHNYAILRKSKQTVQAVLAEQRATNQPTCLKQTCPHEHIPTLRNGNYTPCTRCGCQVDFEKIRMYLPTKVSNIR